jgi:hypothetical protein
MRPVDEMRHEPGDPGEPADACDGLGEDVIRLLRMFAIRPKPAEPLIDNPAAPAGQERPDLTGRVLALTVPEARAVMSALASKMLREIPTDNPDMKYIQRLEDVVHRIAGTPPRRSPVAAEQDTTPPSGINTSSAVPTISGTENLHENRHGED